MPILAFVSFLVCAAYVPGIASAATAGRWCVIGAAAALLAWSLPAVHLTPGHRWGMALLGWCALGLFWSDYPPDTLHGLVQLALLAVMFCVAAQCANEHPAWLWAAIGLGLLVSMPFSLLQTMGVDLVDRATSGAPGLFLNRGTLAEVACIAIIGLIGTRQWLLAVWVFALLLLTEAREPLLVLPAVGAIALWRSGYRTGAASIVGAAAAALAVDLLAPDRLSSFASRLAIWGDTIAALNGAGHGLGAFAGAFPQHEFAHNEPLQILYELGPVGLILIGGLVVHALRTPNANVERLALVAIIVEGVVSFPLHTPATVFLFAVLAGRLCGLRDCVRVAEPRRAAGSLQRAHAAGTDGDGALRAARVRGEAVAARPQHSVRPGAVRLPLRSDPAVRAFPGTADGRSRPGPLSLLGLASKPATPAGAGRSMETAHAR